ncbi:ATP-dependent DNA ligase [Fistulina hepatica ATCC 64428]|uniref:DNA ligase n=1 Tax=Fistulina hepatica ATCC 64428 TaxID=1128425 RepID=A0A0D7ALJ0_9AGAR|nr:ATP-dependent DNA ligase [Fistulina hepatica ATCC 64428]
MGRQQTLAKFFDMPKGRPAPPQQASLKEMWGQKRKVHGDASASVSNVMKDEQTTDEETNETEPASPRKAAEKRSLSPDMPKAKRRRIVESDDEQETAAGPSTSQASGSSSKGLASSKKGTGKHSVAKKAEDDAHEDVAQVSQPNSEGEDEVMPSDDEEIVKEASKSGTKIAEAALSRIKDVDVKGGWKTGAHVPYAALTKTFSLVEATTKRLEKIALLTAFFLLVIRRSKTDDDQGLLQAVYLCINRASLIAGLCRICPDYVGVELGIGESLLIKAIAESTGRSLAVIKADLKKEGDLGLVAMNSKNSQGTLFKPKALTLPFVFANLKEIALSTGNSSQAKKVSIITKLLAACQDFEAKFIIRSVEGKLRIGNADRSVLVAVAHAAVLAEYERNHSKWSNEKLAVKLEEGAEILKSVYSELPSYDEVIPALLKYGIFGLQEHCRLTPGVPLKPMLAKPTKAIGEVLDRFENKRFTCEYKYDGERAQVHFLENGKICVFSRNSEDMSKKYPDLVEQIPLCMKEGVKSFVLDSEAVAIDRDTLKLMPFQELSKRKRKDVKLDDIKIKVCLHVFDLLYLNGEPLLHKTLSERRQLLQENFNVVPGEFHMAKSSDNETTEEIQAFLEESIKDGCEGLMVKMLESDASYYEPSRRTVNWLKLKKDYLAGIGDSLDLVVVGAFYGKGKRTNVYGAFLLACYDPDIEEYHTICKIGTGFSEEILQSHYNVLKPLETTSPRGDVKHGGPKPDIWFEPKVVWEVLAADLSLSPIYTAAMGLAGNKGISLRFPRFIRIRDDKDPDDATGPEQIADMYKSQALAQSSGKGKKGNDDGDDFW